MGGTCSILVLGDVIDAHDNS